MVRWTEEDRQPGFERGLGVALTAQPDGGRAWRIVRERRCVRGKHEGVVLGRPEPQAVRLLGEPEARSPHPGEVIYRDDVGAICRRWNWKEADRTKVTEQTRNALVVVESMPPIENGAVEAAIQEIARSVRALCGGTVCQRALL